MITHRARGHPNHPKNHEQNEIKLDILSQIDQFQFLIKISIFGKNSEYVKRVSI